MYLTFEKRALKGSRGRLPVTVSLLRPSTRRRRQSPVDTGPVAERQEAGTFRG